MLLSIEQRLAQLLNVNVRQVVNTVQLIDEGATVPFIARYRKEVTGGLDDNQLRELDEKLSYLRELDERREAILKSIKEQEKLTPELEQTIYQAENKTTLEDLYLPYKPKRRTKAKIAIEAGLEPLALNLLHNQDLDPEAEAGKYINEELAINTTKDALDGAKYILLDVFAQEAGLLGILRTKLSNEAMLCTSVIEGKEELGEKFRDYFNHNELIKNIPSHRALAILRGFNEKILTMNVAYAELENPNKLAKISYEEIICEHFNILENKAASKFLNECVRLAWRAKIFTSLETELITTMRESADEEAIKVFANNLHNLLLQAPAGAKTTIGLDPGIRTGVKVAVIDKTSKVLGTMAIYPFTKNEADAMHMLKTLIERFDAELISIGNGTASRETEAFAKKLIQQCTAKPQVVVVSEAGASVYSASEYASKEFPDMDVSLRGAVSIARRLQDPLAELVKIDPKSIGVGQYQHDVNQSKLSRSLDNVVEDCVNMVGVDVNTATSAILSRISGLNATIANNIVEYRNTAGRFNSRNEFKKVPRLGDKAFEQCAGFLRISDGKNVLDKSAVHPESYSLVAKIAESLNLPIEKLIANSEVLKTINPRDFVSDEFGLPTITDVIKELDKPGRDPRGEFKTATFKDGVNEISDLVVGMELEGVVTNVTNFGAFVDIGVHQDGLVHISMITDRYITNPNEVLKTGQIVKVHVLEVDAARKRIALSMKGMNKLNVPVSSGGAKKTTNKPVVNTPAGSMAHAFAALRK